MNPLTVNPAIAIQHAWETTRSTRPVPGRRGRRIHRRQARRSSDLPGTG